MNIFIDTNVLLDFYRLSSGDLEELRKIAKLSKAERIRLFISDYVKDEFSRNREAAIAAAIESFKKSRIDLQLPNLVRVYSSGLELLKLKEAFEEKKDYLLDEILKNIDSSSLIADSVIDEFFKSTDIHVVSEEVIRAGAERRAHAKPPGKKDSCGDAVNWEWLLSVLPVTEDLFIISADKDYQSPLYPETLSTYLREEWRAKKNSNCILFTSLTTFLHIHFPDIKLADEVDRVCAIEQLETSPNFATTHSSIQELQKFDDFKKEEILRLINAYLNNDQVSRILGDEDVSKFSYKLMDYATKAGLYDEVEPLIDMIEELSPTESGSRVREKRRTIKIYLKKEIDGKCPYCGSCKIGKIGKVKIEPGGPNYEVWKCDEDECKGVFHVSLKY